MAIKFKHVLKGVDDKKLKTLTDLIRTLDPEEYYRVFVLDLKKVRSTKLNRYYWGVILDTLARLTGYNTEELHEIFKAKFNLKTATLNGTLIEYGGSTAAQTNKEFIDYCEKIRAWANMELDADIPLPNEMSDAQLLELINSGR